jgi:8-oxo-dGTP diphosphatase
MSLSAPRRTIAAAGCVVVRPRPSGGEPDILLVHRPRYNDWSLPKGKLDPQEYLPGCAVRETWEESGVVVRLGQPLPPISYGVNGGSKTVSYWRAQVLRERRHRPGSEVDEIRWLPVSEALHLVSYVDELSLIHTAADAPETVPLVILRHGKAMLRQNWTGRDQARPLDARGRRQAQLLVPLLKAYGVKRTVSSSSVRCQQTVQPFAKALRGEVEAWQSLSEEQAKLKPKAAQTVMKRLLADLLQRGEPTVVCGHRPVLPLMLEAVGAPVHSLKPGAALVVHFTAEGGIAFVEQHRPLV